MADDRLEARVGAMLRAKGWTISTAESCTGGLVMHRLTNVAGSSDYVLGGIVAYSNEAKQSVLHVQERTLIEHGAVSEPVAAEMASCARALFGTDMAVSVTGIAGPGGGTAQKPVGLTYIGVAAPGRIQIVRRYVWDGDREANKTFSAEAALDLVLEALEEWQE
jgi:nicotinamide-nucleotide amidase